MLADTQSWYNASFEHTIMHLESSHLAAALSILRIVSCHLISYNTVIQWWNGIIIRCFASEYISLPVCSCILIALLHIYYIHYKMLNKIGFDIISLHFDATYRLDWNFICSLCLYSKLISEHLILLFDDIIIQVLYYIMSFR